MRFSARIRSVYRNLFRRKQLEADLHEELSSYIDEETQRKINAGASPESARRQAVVEAGGLEQIKEVCRDVRHMRWTESFFQDARYGLRIMRRFPGVTAIALLSLSLGIGVNTVVFSLLNATLGRPLPYPELERLVLVRAMQRDNPERTVSLSRSDCEVLKEAEDVFEAFGCSTDDMSSSVAEEQADTSAPDSVLGQQLTAGLARALAVNPVRGRWFTEEEDRPGADLVILIGNSLWQRRFDGAVDVLGKRVRVGGESATIIGVMPDEFGWIESGAQFWMPLRNPAAGRQSGARVLAGFGRLKPGISLQRAQTQVEAFARGMEEQAPDARKGWSIVLQPLSEEYGTGSYPDAAIILQGAVLFVLLIACANVSGLLLAQATTHYRELAVRAALGSSRWRIFRQSLTHSALLACLGGVLALAIGAAGLKFLTNNLPAGFPPAVYRTHLDAKVLAFTFVISLVCGVAAGIVPALQVSLTQPLDVLRESGRSATAGATRQRLRCSFVVLQIALAFILMIAAGLMFKALSNTALLPLGFDPDNLLTVEVNLPDAKFRHPADHVMVSGSLEMRIDPQVQLTAEQIRESLAAIPGVASASAIAIRPPNSGAINMPFRITGRGFQETQRAQFIPVMPDYFTTLHVKVVHGREFQAKDSAGTIPVAIINETMARRFWPGENPVGNLIRIDSPLLPTEEPRQIVGVVADIAQYSGQQDRPQFYLPFSQLPLVHDERLTNDLRRVTFVMRTHQASGNLTAAITAAVNQADRTQAISRIRTMEQTAFAKERTRVFAALLATFGGIAVMLAMIGIYGVMSQVVTQRTNEIGIRIAVGARATDIWRLVIRQGTILIVAGLFGGVLGSIAVTRILRGFLAGVSSTDRPVFLMGLALLGGIALLACYVPARRASRIDPITALRHD